MAVKKREKSGVAVIIVEEEIGENKDTGIAECEFQSTTSRLPRIAQMLRENSLTCSSLQLEIPLDTILQILNAACERKVEVPAKSQPSTEAVEGDLQSCNAFDCK